MKKDGGLSERLKVSDEVSGIAAIGPEQRSGSSLLLACCAIVASVVTAYMAAYWGKAAECETAALAASDPVRYLGELRQGTVATSFDLFNQSSTSLHILHVLQSCDCAEVKVPAKEVVASEHVKLDCVWDTRGKRGRATTSLAVVYKKAGADKTQSLRLRLLANVVPEVVYSPTELVFHHGVNESKTIGLSCKSQDGFAISRAYCTQGAFQVNSCSGDSVVVSFDPALWPGGWSSYNLVVETNNSVEPTCVIPLRVLPASPQ